MNSKRNPESPGQNSPFIGRNMSAGTMKSQQQLKSRLYDKGFNMGTMPSIKRPDQAKNQEKILTAVLTNQQKRHQKNEPIIYQPQSFVLHHKDQALPLLKGKKHFDSNEVRDDQMENPMVQSKMKSRQRAISQKPTQSTQTLKTQQQAEFFGNQQNSSNKKRDSIHQKQSTNPPFQGMPSTQDRKKHTQSANLKSRNRIMSMNEYQNINIKGVKRPESGIVMNDAKFSTHMAKTNDLQHLGANTMHQSQFQQTMGDDLLKRTRGWDENEMERSKYMIDKLSGKFNVDKRYLQNGQNSKKPGSSQQNRSKKIEEDLNESNYEIKQEEEHQKTEQNLIKRPPSKLDKYIDLILKNVTNVNEFIYLKRQNEDDPYDLQVIDFKKIQEEEKRGELKEYYTISRKGLCQYVNGKPVEFIQLAYFLKERETYDQIKALQFFTKFRKWKTLKMWKKNVIKHKNQNVAKALGEKLFILNPIMRKTLLEFRKKTYDVMLANKFIGMDPLEHHDEQDNSKNSHILNNDPVFTLQRFKDHQEITRRKVRAKIHQCSQACREIVRFGFDESLNELRKNQYMANNEEEGQSSKENQKKQNQNFFRLKESAYEALGFSDNMTYEKRSELRKECSKFLRFAYLVDFIAMESLSNIYKYSVLALEEKMKEIIEEDEEFIIKDLLSVGMGNIDPMFQVSVDATLSEDLIADDDYKVEKIKEFAPHPIGQSLPEDFNFLYHVHLKKQKAPKAQQTGQKKKQQQEEDSQEDFLDEDAEYDRIVIPNITKIWLNVSPDRDVFTKDLLRCIGEGGNSIQAFERWSRHDEMRKYVHVLEEWDSIVGDDWERPDSNYLNPQQWLETSPNEMMSYTFRVLIEKAFNKADSYIQRIFKDFLMTFWEYQKIDFELFKNQNLAHISDAYYYTLKSLNSQKERFEKEIPYCADLGLLRIDTKELRKQIVSEPERIIKQFQEFVPQLLKQRNEEVQKWAVQQANLLKGNSPNIEDFVKKQNYLKETQKLLPKIKQKFQDIEQINRVFVEFKYEIPKKIIDDIVESSQDIKRLDNIIMSAEEQSERNLERYAKNVTQQLIPELEKQTHELDSKVQENRYIQEIELEVAISELSTLDSECQKLDEKSKLYNHYEKTLNLPISRFEDLENTKNDLSLRFSMWKSLKEWQQLTETWIDGKFTDINVQEIKQKGDYYTKVVNKCSKKMVQNPVLDKLKTLVFNFKETMPVVVALRNKDLQDYHWSEIKRIIGQDFTIDDEFKLRDLVNMDVVKCVDEIQEVATQATQEAVLKQMYENLLLSWKQQKFQVTEAKEGRSKDIVLLTAIDELFTQLDDLLANLNNILGSRYLKTMRDEVDALQKKVLYSQETIDDMLVVQKNWIYLENIFKSSEIKVKLKEETSQFEKVDSYFKKQMNNIKKNQLVYKCIGTTSKKDWNKQKETLNTIQQALENLLEDKRTAFPRFYFLSNDELLEILAKQGDIEAIQRNMKKCFDCVQRLIMADQGSRQIVGMQSPEGEQIRFIGTRQVTTKGDVEGWLLQFQDAMRDTISKKMKRAKMQFEDPEQNKERIDWVLEHPAQIVATISQVIWTAYTEHFIHQQQEGGETGLYDWAGLNHSQLEGLTKLITQGGLTDIQHKSVVALITQDVHSRDIIDSMVDEGVNHVTDFLWQKQLRYYWDDAEEAINVKQVNACIRYGCEYMGATSRLVITPLTDRCWMTITGALNIQLGASPAGPAGTGKTESTKDLGKGLGLLCVVFNCSEQIEYKMMGRLFSGLSEQGAWSCLDEFNRIDIEVLSVIAQQLLTIRTALLKKDEKFLFGDKMITLKAEGYGVFITMNPGYAGRTELPDNLKVLFRPVAMMIPDYGMIAEIMLFSEGFENASSLSKKMVQLYKLSSEQLSQQDHYDFGMRAVKSVLNMAGNLKREQPNLNEDAVLIRAMIDSNVPKFLKDDLPLFRALIQDLFPAIIIPEPNYGELPQQIEDSMARLHYQKVPELTKKVTQLFETFNVRFGVMIVGLTTSGKTSCYRILADAMTELRKKSSVDRRFQEVQCKVLNPKCITMGELYGEVNPLTYEWNDGLASQIMRAASSDETDLRQWIVFDGPVDSLWIENMNTVLDDNMMLCLANGQRIKLRPQMRMLFEVQDLKVASPATVSRCGMVYMMYEDLGWRPYVQSWIENRFMARKIVQKKVIVQDEEEYDSKNKVQVQDEVLNEEMRNHLMNSFDNTVDQAIGFIRKKFQEQITTVDLQLVISLCNLLDCFISEKFGFKPKDSQENIKRYLSHAFAFAFTWSIGITIGDKYHDRMDTIIRDLFPSIIFPSQDKVYGYYLDNTDFKHWNDKIDDFQYDVETPYFNLLVPTIDTCRYSYIMEWLILFKKNIYVTGQGGTGKSVVIASLLDKIREPQSVDNFQLIFSAQTNSYVTQLAIEDKLKKKSKQELGAISGHQNVIFIDDVNMPSVEVYGAQPPIELLRLYLDQGFLWDRKERFLKMITDTSLICCSAPPGGGRAQLTQRFTRHFNLLTLPQPSQQILFKIFNSLLSGFFDTLSFQNAVKQYSQSIVDATIDIYLRIQAEKLPIPSKFHYTFNLRDVSKVFQGIMMCQPGVIRNEEQITNLWIHEVSRVFHDRLINDIDKDWFYDVSIELLNRYFKGMFEKKEIFIDNTIMFSDILRLDVGNKEYEQILDLKKLHKALDDKLDDYNSDDQNSSKMHLVFFDQATSHLLRIMRILRTMRGNAMLIGVGGSGKQSLTRLASYILENKNEQIEIKKDYNSDSFREFIQKNLMIPTGLKGIGVTFLFTDSQILQESFLEDINNILNSGEVPNMWKQEDKDAVLNDVKDLNAKMKKPTDPDSCQKTFVERVRNNLHIVLCMSPIGEALRVRCRQFPSLIDCCTLDWFSQWPEQALQDVAERLIKDDLTFPQSKSVNQDELIHSLSVMCKEVHIQSQDQAEKFEAALRRRVYNTPKSYLDLIKLYKQALNMKIEELSTSQKRLSSGLTKLEQANKQIAELQITLTSLKPELEKQNIAVAEALVMVEKDTILAQQQEAVVSEETEKVQKQKDRIQLIADEAQSELDKVLPELNKAQEAVEKIDRNQLVNLRSMPNPPTVVLMVFEGVCALMGQKNDWATCKLMLLDLNKFISSLVNYDKDNIPNSRLKKLNQALAKPEFDIPTIQLKVPYAADMAMFCRAMKIYADTNEKVKPKKEMVAKLQSELDVANAALNKQLDSLNKVKMNVQRLRDETNKMLNKKEELEKEMELTEARLIRAKKLISLTGDEAKRWEVTVSILADQIENLFGDVFLSSAQISYTGPFTGVYRKELIDNWVQQVQDHNIPKSEHYSMIKTLGDPMQLREWVIQGLPSDTVSQENSILVSQGYRWPLLIDPQLQASKWIKNMESENDLKILKMTGNWIRILTNAISNGNPVLIEDIDETLDPGLEPILSKAFYEIEGRIMIRFADNDILYHKDFRVYMTTKKPNPSYLPEIFIKVTVINFTSTFEGLEDQLLADVVKNERPEVEQQRDENVQNLAQFKKKIEQSEKDILKLLAEAKASTILDDENLINTLEVSKVTAIEINEKLKESEILEKEINDIRDSYRKVSIRGSILYFVIKDLSLIDPMYQYSLQYIQRLFNVAIANTQLSEIHEERLENLIDNLTKIIFTNVCRGLFEKDKLIFSFLIATSINKNSGILSEALWSVFLRGAGVFDKSKQPPNPNKDLISFLAWDLAYYLEITYDRFKGLTGHIINNIDKWKQYSFSPDPLETPMPDDWDKHGIFEKMLLLKIFRPEKILFASSKYVFHYLGQFFLESPHASMDKIYADSDTKTPIIFVLSQGADPTSNVIQFTKSRQMEDRLKFISLGQGQGERAKLLIEEGQVKGNWVFMQNCHLARTWMPTLEVILNDIRENDEKEIHPDFRIFLTSMPANYFPVSVLQNGIKLTTEPPRGLKANLKRSWNNFSQEFLDSCKKENYQAIFHKLVWGLTYFHAIIQERRKFGPLGWNIRYEFNDSDLETSTQVMKMLLEEQETIPWDSMLFVSGHINYGGRVTDDWDRRCLITLLKKFYTPDILKDKYMFSGSHIYSIPPLGLIENYRIFIEDLPLHEDPIVFGLNENANITYQSQESNNLIQTILQIQPKSTGGASGKSNDQIVLELVQTIQDQTPDLLNKEDSFKECFEVNPQGLIHSLATVLLQEMQRFNKLLSTIKTSLKHLKLAIEGLMVMSSDLDACYYSLLNNQVPQIWVKVAYPSLKPLAAWILDLIERVNTMKQWLTTGYPHCYWLSGFFFPQGFLTGVLQTYARKYETAIDQLDFTFKVQEIDKEGCTIGPQDGVYIYGLFLEGAQWDRKKKTLADSVSGQTYCQMPIIYFNPIENYEKKEENYSCPVYKTSTRAGVLSTTGQSTNFIIAVDLPSQDFNPDFWTLRGSAMLCQLNE